MIEYKPNMIIPGITKVYKVKRKRFSDHVLCFDLEATSLFRIDGDLKSFDYSKPPEYYIDKDKYALPYIWMFGYDDTVYYSRDFHSFGDFLLALSDTEIEQTIFVHNLSYEFQWLLSIFIARGWHLSDILARGMRKVISFHVDEINITFRCTYALTNLSLERCAEYYKCKVKKLVGNLDYNKARSPLTHLTDEELAYCSHDIEVMTDFLNTFLEQYRHIKRIPITQTGEVRKEINSEYIDYWYHRDVWDKIPPVHIYMALMCAFMGGIAHPNMANSGKILLGIMSGDYTSRYPACMTEEDGYPVGQWFTMDVEEIDDMKDRYAILYHVRWKGIRSRFLNHYIPISKCVDKLGCRVDNGRLMEADMIEMYLTDIDYDIIKQAYDIDSEEILDVWGSRKGRLPKEIVLYILEMYGRKTKLKGVASTPDYDAEAYYAKSKQAVNSLFGISCYNPIKQAYDFDLYRDGDPWTMKELNSEYLNEKLADMKKSYSIILPYSVGCWVTAYARRELFQWLITGDFGRVDKSMDRDTVYYDTDSNKFKNPADHMHLIDVINQRNLDKIKAACEYYEISPDLFSPKDIKGIPHTLGELEIECTYDRFKTLGAKKYAYEINGELHITIAGVPKKAGKLLGSLEDFNKGFVFGYEAGKLMMCYDDKQDPFTFEDIDGNIYHCDDISHAIIAQPTTYELGITEDYEALIEYFDNPIYY